MLWNVVEKTQKIILRSYDGRPLRFTEKRYADRLAQELNNMKENSCLRFEVSQDDKNN